MTDVIDNPVDREGFQAMLSDNPPTEARARPDRFEDATVSLAWPQPYATSRKREP